MAKDKVIYQCCECFFVFDSDKKAGYKPPDAVYHPEAVHFLCEGCEEKRIEKLTRQGILRR